MTKQLDLTHVLNLAGYHVSCIMADDKPSISCSPHRDMPVFEHDLDNGNRIHVRNLYMAEVAKLILSLARAAKLR